MKLAYSSVKEGSDVEILRILTNGIGDSLFNIDSLPKRIKDFYKVILKRDVFKLFHIEWVVELEMSRDTLSGAPAKIVISSEK